MVRKLVRTLSSSNYLHPGYDKRTALTARTKQRWFHITTFFKRTILQDYKTKFCSKPKNKQKTAPALA